jgi:hypothetical protein
MSGRRGVCPFAGAAIDDALSGPPRTAVVLTTACDQMRYAASVLEHHGSVSVFLMNVSSTWQTQPARSLYRDELWRMGRFLVRLGGKAPSEEELAQVMLRFDRARKNLRQARDRLSAREFAEALARVRETAALPQRPPLPLGEGWGEGSTRNLETALTPGPSPASGRGERSGVPLALVGGPLAEKDYSLFGWVERAGGRIVLDASEGGERTLPCPFDPARTRSDPFDELADAYFGGIPDIFRRPNDPCYEYLGREMAARQVRGVVFRRYLWCDLWHAELARLKARTSLPVLDLDVAQSEAGAEGRAVSRIEAFLETLS